jgi:hypothetical protein
MDWLRSFAETSKMESVVEFKWLPGSELVLENPYLELKDLVSIETEVQNQLTVLPDFVNLDLTY